MDSFNVQISGLEDIERLLSNSTAVLREALPDALEQAGDVLAQEVRARATGGGKAELASAVLTGTEMQDDKLRGSCFVGFEQTLSERTKQPMDAVAEWVELGHAMETHSHKTVGHVPAEPFMRPAVDSASDRVIDAFASALESSLAGQTS